MQDSLRVIGYVRGLWEASRSHRVPPAGGRGLSWEGGAFGRWRVNGVKTQVIRQRAAQVWELVRRQHGVISHGQLIGLGFNQEAIAHRIATGRLYPIHRGVYAVGRPEVGPLGKAMAAALACGGSALANHLTAAFLTGITASAPRDVHVSIEGINHRARRHHHPPATETSPGRGHDLPRRPDHLTAVDAHRHRPGNDRPRA